MHEVQIFWKYGFNTTSVMTEEQIEALKDNVNVISYRY